MEAALSAGEEWNEAETGRIGVWLFLLSEMLLFGAILAAYVSTRLGNAECALGVVVWPEAARLPGLTLAALNTILLLTSSYTMVRAIRRAEKGDKEGFRSNLIATLLLGAAFLGVKAFEYSLKISHGYYPGSELARAGAGLAIFLSYYYAMTILHALHVVAGLVWNSVVLVSVSSNSMSVVARRAEYAGLYWHFVDIVWVILFPLLYLI